MTRPRGPSLGTAIFVTVWLLMTVPVFVSVVWAASVLGLGPVGGLELASLVPLAAYTVLAAALSIAVARAALVALARWLTEAQALDSGLTARRVALPPELDEVRDAYLSAIRSREHGRRQLREAAATIVHDLKAPIVGIRNVVRMMHASEVSGRTVDPGLPERLSLEVEQLARQVSHGVLSLRVASEEDLGSLQRVDLSDLVRDAVRRVDASRCSVTVVGSALCVCDPDLMGRALFNLIENAVRYARSSVAIEILPGLIRVADDGPGLPIALNELVRPFAGGGSAASAGMGGLGLAMAHGALAAHGGRLTVERSDDRGTVLLAYVGRRATEVGP